MNWFKNLFWKDDAEYGTTKQVDITQMEGVMSFDEALIFLSGHDLWSLYDHCDDYTIRMCATKLEGYLGEPTINDSKTY